MCCEKTDGIRYWMWCWKHHITKKQMIILINRALQVYSLEANTKSCLFDGEWGTLIDCELVEHEFVAFDIYMDGSSILIAKEPLAIRFARLEHVVASIILAPPFTLVTKQFYPLSEIKKCILSSGKSIQQNPSQATIKTTARKCRTDGLIFVPLYIPPKFGKDKMLFKWKEHHTVDFLIHWQAILPSMTSLISFSTSPQTNQATIAEQERGNVAMVSLSFYLEDEQQHLIFVLESRMPVYQLELLFANDNLSNNNDYGNNDNNTNGLIPTRFIGECFYNKSTSQWQIEKVRRDKTRPNSKFTFEKTVENIRDHIDESEILCLADSFHKH
jgi:hypothetical protein